MRIKTFVELKSEFPDDSEWDANGNLLVPGGRAVITWIAQSLQENGFECGKIAQKSFYGWQLQVHTGEIVSQLVLQEGLNWLLICEPMIPLWHRLFQNTDSILQKLLSAVDFILRNDSRISRVQWFTRKEYEAGENRRRRYGRPQKEV